MPGAISGPPARPKTSGCSTRMCGPPGGIGRPRASRARDVLELLDGVVARGSRSPPTGFWRSSARCSAGRSAKASFPPRPPLRSTGQAARKPPAIVSSPRPRSPRSGRPPASSKSPYSQLVRLLLITGQRRGEVAGMSRRELDLDAKLWTIPRTRTKNGLDHEVPLSALALEILRPLLPAEDKRQFLFTSGRRGDRPIQEFKNAKRRLDAEILETRRERAERHHPAEVIPMPHWTCMTCGGPCGRDCRSFGLIRRFRSA